MALIVGNLLTDPAAQSFISLADAVAYLEVEAAGQSTGTPLGDWMAKLPAEQEGSLVTASRWLAHSFQWRDLSDADLVRVGRVAARLAVETVGRNMFGGPDANGIAVRKKAGEVEIAYREGVMSDAAGLVLPWLKLSLHGLLRGNTKWLLRA